ncbi:MAG: hypothetical protein ABMA15_18495 [Vicinamibacterales bacterium]
MSTRTERADSRARRRAMRLPDWFVVPLALLVGIPILALLIPWLVVTSFVDSIRRRWLTARFRSEFVPRGVVGILVYSNSPNWQAHIEAEVIPRLAGRVATVNWSDRSTWNRTSPLPVRLFRLLKPHEDFNPMGLVLSKDGEFESVALRPGYIDLKHGNGARLESDLTRLQELIDAAALRVAGTLPT